MKKEGYKKLDRGYLFNEFQQLIFAEDEEIKNSYIPKFRLLENRGGWISRKEKDVKEMLARDAALMNKQKGFIPFV